MGKKWKVKDSVGVSTIPSNLFCFKFKVEEDVNVVLLETWYYDKHCLALTKWHMGFDASLELKKLALVWVRLPGLPLEL